MAFRREIPKERLENLVLSGGKKFVSYKEGAELLSIGLHSFEDLAKDAKAVYKMRIPQGESESLQPWLL